MRHPSLLGNKQAQALSELRGGHSLVWEMVLASLPGAPLFSPRPWMSAHDYWDPWVTTGMTAAAPGVWMLVVWLWQGVWLPTCPCVLWGLPAQPCLQLGLSVTQDDWVCMQTLDGAISHGDYGCMAEPLWRTNCSQGMTGLSMSLSPL